MLRIIIVEDEYRARTGLMRLINEMGVDYQVIACAEDGYEGMLLAQQLKPDVVFTDIAMPRINGLEMIKHLAATEQKCRFVIITGYADFAYAQQSIRLGVVDYLLKPITITAVRKLLDKIACEISPTAVAVEKEQSVQRQNWSLMISEIVHQVDTHYIEKLSLEKFATEFSVTPEYLSTLFSKQVGQSFVRYLKEIRMKHAKKLLVESNKKIYQIAFDVGYTDVKYFCRVFKEMTGLSPKEYARKQCDGLENK